jgi:hypothetical protein
MIEFRQKEFGKAAKKVVKVIKKSFKENPVGLTLTTVGTAGTGVNITLNSKRKNNEKEFYDKQIKSTKNLTKSLNKLYGDDEEIKNSIKFYHKEHTKTPPKDPTSDYIDAIKGSSKTYKLKRSTK